MALSNARKQARFRARQIEGDRKRVQLVLSLDSALALQRLARHRGTTQGAVIESLLMDERGRITASMDADDYRSFVGE